MDLEELKKELEVIELDERLEMVQLTQADELEESGGDSVCCNSSCQ